MLQILQEQDFQLTGCTSNECAVEVRQMLAQKNEGRGRGCQAGECQMGHGDAPSLASLSRRKRGEGDLGVA